MTRSSGVQEFSPRHLFTIILCGFSSVHMWLLWTFYYSFYFSSSMKSILATILELLLAFTSKLSIFSENGLFKVFMVFWIKTVPGYLLSALSFIPFSVRRWRICLMWNHIIRISFWINAFQYSCNSLLEHKYQIWSGKLNKQQQPTIF